MYDAAVKKLLGLDGYETLEHLDIKTPTTAQAILIAALVISDAKDEMTNAIGNTNNELRLIREQLSELRNQLQGYDTNSTLRLGDISNKLDALRNAWLTAG